MKYRDLARMLRDAGFVPRPGKGDHEVWRSGKHGVTITRTREVSPGLVSKALGAIERSKHE